MAASVPYSHHGASYAWADDDEKLLDGPGVHSGVHSGVHAGVQGNGQFDTDLADFTSHSQSSYTNPNYDACGETPDADDASKLITKREKQTLKQLRKWRQFQEQLTTNQNDVLQAIEQRRNDLIDRLNNETDDAKSELQRIFKGQYSMVEQKQRVVEKMLQEIGNVRSERESSNTNTRKLKKRLAQISKENDSVGTIPEWESVQFQPSAADITKEEFGTISGGPSRHQAWSEDELEPESKASTFEEPDPEPENILLSKPELQRSFSIKTSKDSRDVGVSDLVVTTDGEIIIVDKHNKLVKVFNSSGRLQRFIGRHQVKEPIRATVIPGDMVLVTDNHSKTIKLFQLDGALLGTFVDDIKHPGSHCMSPDGNQIAVVEFSSCTVIVYSTDGLQQMSFPLPLECPAFICSTTCATSSQPRYILTDWKHHKLAVFNQQGDLIHSIEGKGSEPGELNQPQGVTVDPFGHIIVADQHNHRIQIFNPNLETLMTLDKDLSSLDSDKPPPSSGTQYMKPLSAHMKTSMQLPTAVAYHPSGLLVTCDYQGKVRLYKYLKQEILPEKSSTKPKKQKKRMPVQDEDETVC